MVNFTGPGSPLGQAGFDAALAVADIDAAALWAVVSVETSGWGFLEDRRPRILFERHVFSRLTGGKFDSDDPDISSRSPGGYGPGGAHQYLRLETAIQFDRESALQSTSWGLGQIMGENYRAAGFGGVEDMSAAFVESEGRQLLGMANFIKSSGTDAPLRNHEWATFARRYNGPNYAAHNYDGLLRHFHNFYTAGGLPDLAARAAQVYLTYKGFSPGMIDGRVGTATLAAVEAYRHASGLPVKPEIDADLITSLAASDT